MWSRYWINGPLHEEWMKQPDPEKRLAVIEGYVRASNGPGGEVVSKLPGSWAGSLSTWLSRVYEELWQKAVGGCQRHTNAKGRASYHL